MGQGGKVCKTIFLLTAVAIAGKYIYFEGEGVERIIFTINTITLLYCCILTLDQLFSILSPS